MFTAHRGFLFEGLTVHYRPRLESRPRREVHHSPQSSVEIKD